MPGFSIVIICRNEAATIGRTLESLKGLTDDIIVYDNGSTDGTQHIVREYDAVLHEGKWEGFGKTKQKAIGLAKYNWILSLDADEAIDSELNNSLATLQFDNERTVYDIRFRNFLGNKYMRYGEWGGDHHIRLFNRKTVQYDDAPVHEQLILPKEVIIKKIRGHVLHATMKDVHEYAEKMIQYAMLNALKYYGQGKRSSWFRIKFAPAFTFFNYYILRVGFLDGHEGFVCAKMTAWYTFLKYTRLRELWKNQQKKE